MNVVIGAATALVCIAFSIGAMAEPCDPLTGETSSLSVENRDEDYMQGLRLGLLTALTPPSFPQHEIEANPNACTRGVFVANDGSYHVFGQFADSPPRWATGPNGRIVYLAIMPPPPIVLDWARRGARGPLTFREEPIYVLAIVNGDTREIFGFFDGVPGDAQLTSAFKDALDGRLPRIATFNVTTGETVFVSRQAL